LFCPKCRAEFREGFTFCRKCNTHLVAELLPLEEKPKITYTQNPETFLISVFDDNQATVVESLLRAYKIPTIRRYNLLGHYFQLYWGLTVFGIELYVPAKALIIAQGILKNKNEEPEMVLGEIEEAELAELQESYQKRRRIRGWIIIFCLLAVEGAFTIAAYGLYQLINLSKEVFSMNSE